MVVESDSLIELLSDHLGSDPANIVDRADIVQDLGANSLDVVEIVMQIEEDYGLEISDEDAEKCKTVGDVREYLKKQGVTV